MNTIKRIALFLSFSILIFVCSACGTTEEGIQKSNTNVTRSPNATEAKIQTSEQTQPEAESEQTEEVKIIPTTTPIADNSTYTTRLSELEALTCPVFQFDYPNNWSISSEEVISNGEPVQGMFLEKVVLKNARGVTITYMDFWSNAPMGYGSIMHQIKTEKVSGSSFVPTTPAGTGEDFSSLGDFMVARLKTVGELLKGVDDDYTKVDGSEYYAVLPNSYEGIHDIVGMDGIYGECQFDYPGPHAIIAEAPGGQFTETEVAEVIDILSSFRIAN